MLKYFIRFFLVFLLVIVLGFSILYFLLNEKLYNLILMQYVSARVIEGCETIEEKIVALREFTHLNVHPVYGEKNRLDTIGIEKLVAGIGWCDQASRVFMQLAKGCGITTRLLFLLDEKGSSPHSIAEAKIKDR
jgi:hypothetical protein